MYNTYFVIYIYRVLNNKNVNKKYKSTNNYKYYFEYTFD